jgi:hypothetical protein
MPVHDWARVPTGIFHDFHGEWIITIKHALNQGVLPPEYYALAEQITGGLHPDVLALEQRDPSSADGNDSSSDTGSNGGVAVAVKSPAVHFTSITELERYARKRNRITIRHVSDDHVVAILEIMSPGNKASRHALRSFVDKTLELLDAGIHLLILDLFPPGPRDPQGIHEAVWSEISDERFELPPDKPLTLAAHAAGVEKIGAYVQPTAVGASLPDMPLFLKDETNVWVPLEATYETAFAAVPRRWREVLAS